MEKLCMVLIRPGHEVDDRRVREMLRPYSADLPVESYEQGCWCVGAVAYGEAEEAADVEFAKTDPERHLRVLSVERPDPENNFSPEEQREIEEHEARFEAVRTRYEKAHPLYGKPSPDCQDCGGTGVDKGYHNPIAEFSEWWTERLPSRKDARLPVEELLQGIEEYPQIWAVVTPEGGLRQRRYLPRKKRESKEGLERRNAPLHEEWRRELEAILRANEDCTAVTVGFYPSDW